MYILGENKTTSPIFVVVLPAVLAILQACACHLEEPVGKDIKSG